MLRKYLSEKPLITTLFASIVVAAALQMNLWTTTAHARQVAIDGASGPLGGELVSSAALEHAMILIPGSGPTDRYGNNPPFGMMPGSYKKLAEGLTEMSISTLLVDKRGVYSSASSGIDPEDIVIADYVDDVRAWARWLKKETGRKCIWIGGHSEGALVAMHLAADEHVCGLVLLAAPGRPLDLIILEQLEASPANDPFLPVSREIIASLKAGKPYDGVIPQQLLGLFRPSIHRFLISLFATDPQELISRSRMPVLLVQGGRDLQVKQADQEALKSAYPKAVSWFREDMNHMLKSVSSLVSDNLSAYRQPERPLSEGLVEVISRFISNQSIKEK